jgi:polyhydroxyalkanoate synthesis regulator phasin
MEERASSSERGTIEAIALAGIGALVLAAGRTDDVADGLAERLGIDPGETRAALSDAVESWRREAQRLGRKTEDAAWRLGADVGIASREDVRELELRVAQLEHRLKLLERSD